MEIYHSDEWGTVCDDFWSKADAAVVCRQLGLPGPATAFRRAEFGEGQDPIWMDNVGCQGDEARLADCRFRGWGIHNCGHSEDAGARCGTGQGAVSLRDAFLSGDSLTLQYGGQLNSLRAPSPDEFVVLAAHGRRVTGVLVEKVAVLGSTVVLGLGRTVSESENLSVSYLEAPMHPIEDDWGNPARPFQDLRVRHLDPEPSASATPCPRRADRQGFRGRARRFPDRDSLPPPETAPSSSNAWICRVGALPTFGSFGGWGISSNLGSAAIRFPTCLRSRRSRTLSGSICPTIASTTSERSRGSSTCVALICRTTRSRTSARWRGLRNCVG